MGERHVTGREGGVVVELMKVAVSESIKQWKYIVNGARKIWDTSTAAHIVKSTVVKLSRISDANNLQ